MGLVPELENVGLMKTLSRVFITLFVAINLLIYLQLAAFGETSLGRLFLPRRLCGQQDPLTDNLYSADVTADGVSVVLTQQRSSKGFGLDYPDGFLYVYDMPQRFTERVFDQTPAYHDTQYDVDIRLHRFLLTSRVRTLNPDAASLFFIPMYLGYYLNTQWSYKPEDKAPFKEGVVSASTFMSDALTHVQTHWPFWNRTNGADHVAVFGYDNGRCDAYGFVRDARKTVGKLISIQTGAKKKLLPSHGTITQNGQILLLQANGDLVDRSWGHRFDPVRAPDDFFCYNKGRDIAVPMWVKPNRAISPFEGNRSIPLLYRFSPKDQHGARYGHEIRKELHKRWVEDPLPGSNFAARTEDETLGDMTRAMFCVTPPGNTQDTTRFWKAISMGCIPVSFFHAFDRPFERSGLLDYDTFTLNLDLDDITDGLNDAVLAVLNNPVRLRSLQEGVARVQGLLQYDEDSRHGSCYDLILKELAIRALSFGKGGI